MTDYRWSPIEELSDTERGIDLGVCAPERFWDLVVGNCSLSVPQEGSVVGKSGVFYSVLGHLVGFLARDFSCGADS